MNKKIIFSAGGTGGHIFPAINLMKHFLSKEYQVLLVTDGIGIVATEKEKSVVQIGDLIHIPAGEKHWHGATTDSHFSHISLTLLSSVSNLFEQ